MSDAATYLTAPKQISFPPYPSAVDLVAAPVVSVLDLTVDWAPSSKSVIGTSAQPPPESIGMTGSDIANGGG